MTKVVYKVGNKTVNTMAEAKALGNYTVSYEKIPEPVNSFGRGVRAVSARDYKKQ